MTKEEYQEMLKHPIIPMYAYFDYYREKGGLIADINEFQTIFTVMLDNRFTVDGSDGNMKEVSPESAYRRFCEYYNNKFGL